MRFYVEYDIKSNIWRIFDRTAVKSIEGAKPPCIWEATEAHMDRIIGDALREMKIIHA